MRGLIRGWYLLLFILIVGLFLYDNVWWRGYFLAIEGVERETQIFGKIINISDDHFYLYTLPANLRVESFNIPNVKKTRYGETVVHVIFMKEGVIEGIDYHNYDYNYFLYLVSFIAFIVFLFIFFKEWKITLRGFKSA